MDNEKFGKYFLNHRQAKGFTQEQIGEVLGVTDKAVSRWERGECFPEITQFVKIAKLFDVTVDELINAEDKPKNLLSMCASCKNKKCKNENYSMLMHCKNSFHWAVYGIIAASLMIAAIVSYLTVRVIDGKWTEWRFPLIMMLVYFSATIISAMVLSLKDVKKDFSKNGKDEKG